MLSNLNREDILEALGLQTRGANWLGPLLLGVGAGALLGVTAALLLAPRPGNELRSELLERGRRIVRQGREAVEEATEGGASSSDPQRH